MLYGILQGGSEASTTSRHSASGCILLAACREVYWRQGLPGARTSHLALRVQCILLVLLLLAQAPASLAEESVALDCVSRNSVTMLLPPSGAGMTLRVDATASEPVVLEILENGQDLSVFADERVSRRSIDVPPRLGGTFFRLEANAQVRIERLRHGYGRGELQAQLICDGDTSETLWNWLELADAVVGRFDGGIGSLRNVDLDSEISELKTASVDDRSRTWAAHIEAQYLLLTGRSVDAADAFAAVADKWEGLGDLARAAAARVGAAEDMVRGGRNQDAIDLARQNPESPDDSHYFGIRLENSRCLALHNLGDLQNASDCYAWTSKGFDVLDELLELASTGLNYAAVERSLGRLDEARVLAQQSLHLAEGPQSAVVQGRAHYTLADLAFRSGQLEEALNQLQEAQARFAVAGEVRWEASMLLRLAAVLTDLGALGDARLAAERALVLLDPQHASSRVASAQVVLARIDSAEGLIASGIEKLLAATTTLSRLQMPEELAIARTELARLQVKSKRIADAASTLHGLQSSAAQVAARIDLTRAELAIEAGQINVAQSALERLDLKSTTFADRLRLERTKAWIDWQQGEQERALGALRHGAEALSRVADDAGNELLAHLLRQSVKELHRTAIEMIARQLGHSSPLEDAAESIAAWQAMLVPRGKRHELTDRGRGYAKRVDHAIATVLLGTPSRMSPLEGSEAWRPILALLSDSGDWARSDEFQVHGTSVNEALRRNGPVLAIIEGEQRGIVMWTGAEQTHVFVLPDLEALRASLEAINRETRAATGSVTRIHELGAELSHRLLGPLIDVDMPSHLVILNDGLASTVPWPLLKWPGDDQPLVERASISFIELATSSIDAHSHGTANINVVQAIQGNQSEHRTTLPQLPGASLEPTLIQTHAVGRHVLVHAAAGRDQLMDVLASPGAWIHITAHGALEAGRLAGSGLWLDPAGIDQHPQYVSWVEIQSRGAGAALAVLNACQLAATDPASATTSMNFATALSRAGVQHVVAARWPVSDTASNLWVPAFYKALTATDPPDPAYALAEARRALRASRAFRHPFHWAGWVHVERIQVDERAFQDAHNH